MFKLLVYILKQRKMKKAVQSCLPAPREPVTRQQTLRVSRRGQTETL